MHRIVAFLIVVSFLCAFLTTAAWAKMTLKFGHVAPPFHGQSKGVEAFADYVKEKTDGEIVIKTFPYGQLGSERSMAEQVQAGTLEMASITTAVMQNFVPQTVIMDMPFVFPDRETAYAVIDDKEWQEKFFSYLPEHGFIGIGWTENGFRDINNTQHPIRKPEDLEGMKIRVMNSPIYMDTFRQLGASPVGIPFPELYNSLQQGVIDAQENPLLTSIMIKATEVAKHVTNTNHILTECIIIVSPSVWDRLSDDQKQIFREAADVAIQTNREVNRELHQSLPKMGISVDEYCQKNDVKLVQLTEEQRQAFAEAIQPVWDKYRDIVGPDLYDFFMSKIEEHSN